MHPDVPSFPYKEARDKFRFLSLTTSLEAIKVLEHLRVECQRVSSMVLFHTGTSKHLKLEEYDQAQQQATTQVSGRGWWGRSSNAPFFFILFFFLILMNEGVCPKTDHDYNTDNDVITFCNFNFCWFFLQTQVYLKDTWVPLLRSSIKTCLDSVTKGWFNTEESNFEVYQGSKLKKLMELIKFAMQVEQDRGMYN